MAPSYREALHGVVAARSETFLMTVLCAALIQMLRCQYCDSDGSDSDRSGDVRMPIAVPDAVTDSI